jgi:hypothetical protein
MRSFSTLDLLGARHWNSALFTTYSLSLAYFEAVVLSALVNGGVDRTFVLADIAGVRAALSEHGARQAGRSYQVEPVAVDRGYCLHAKLTALVAEDDAHLIIGSGNLTAGGYGGNLECAEHLHPSFAADVFDDVAAFLEALGTTDTARHAAIGPCGSMADDLRRRAAGAARTGSIRAVSSLEGAIIDQLAGFADELGGARRLTIASPFFDGGAAIDALRGAMGLDHVNIHAHPTGSVASAAGMAWPTQAKTPIRAVTVEPLEESRRPLHAKVFEVVCRRGRLIMSGSANGTLAALTHGRNIELSVVRILREPSVGWRLSPAEPLHADVVAADDDAEAEAEIGILRAEMSGDVLEGQVLTGFPAGEAELLDLTGSGPLRLATTTVSADGHFAVATRSLEMEGWRARRLVIRLQSSADGRIAEGLVHFPDIGAITRRAGPVAARLLALIAGNDTPDDVAAVMTWFHDHPEHLQSRVSGSHGGPPTERTNAIASVAGLVDPQPVITSRGPGGSEEGAGWRRFMVQVWAAFTTPGSSIQVAHSGEDPGEDEDEPSTPAVANKGVDDGISNATERFDRLFDKLLGEDDGRCDLGAAVQITQYVCERLRLPEGQVERYLDRLLMAMADADIPDSDGMAMAGIVLVATARKQGASKSAALRGARRRLLRLGVPIASGPPDMEFVRGFVRVLAPNLDSATLWAAIQGIRTYHEEVAAYWQTPPGAVDKADFPALAGLRDWDELAKATTADRRRMHYLSRCAATCPKHHMTLPDADADALSNIGVARTANCCKELILLGEEV